MLDLKEGEDCGGKEKSLEKSEVEVVPCAVTLDKVDRPQEPGQEEDQRGDDGRDNPHNRLFVNFVQFKNKVEKVSDPHEGR